MEKSEVKDVVYPHESLQKIENSRKAFLDQYRKGNTLKTVVAAICIALIVVAFIVIPNVIHDNDNLRSGLMLGITGVAVIGVLGYSAFSKKSINAKMHKYFADFYNFTNEFVFDQEGFENPVLQEPGKINIDQFNEANLYKDIVEVGSRGLTEFTYNKFAMAVVDCAGNIRGQKRMTPVFVGKYLFAACNYTDPNPIIIYIKGNEKALPPTNLEGINVVEENEKFVIYTNNSDYKKVLNKKVMQEIEKFQTNSLLVDVAISMHDGKLHIMLGYDDPIMILPLQNQFDSKPYESYKEDLPKYCRFIEVLNK